jgi:hypothetical protein
MNEFGATGTAIVGTGRDGRAAKEFPVDDWLPNHIDR